MDFIFSYNDYEVGCGECGMDVTTKCTKELSDCGHKMPKVMRDMLSKLVSYSPSLKRKLFISGYYNGEKPLKMVLLDTPVGYVTRYDALKFVRYPQNHNELFRQLSAVLQTIVAGRMLMENTDIMLTSDDTDISIGRCQEEHMIPSFVPNGSNSKRQRRS